MGNFTTHFPGVEAGRGLGAQNNHKLQVQSFLIHECLYLLAKKSREELWSLYIFGEKKKRERERGRSGSGGGTDKAPTPLSPECTSTLGCM